MKKTWFEVTISLQRRRWLDGYICNQSMLLEKPEDRETAHKLLDAMFDKMGVPK